MKQMQLKRSQKPNSEKWKNIRKWHEKQHASAIQMETYATAIFDCKTIASKRKRDYEKERERQSGREKE